MILSTSECVPYINPDVVADNNEHYIHGTPNKENTIKMTVIKCLISTSNGTQDYEVIIDIVVVKAIIVIYEFVSVK